MSRVCCSSQERLRVAANGLIVTGGVELGVACELSGWRTG